MTAPEEIITKYAQLRTDAPPTALEEEMLRLWATEGLFDKIGAAHVDDPEWVFYEGPPTANGRPGIHHVFSRTIKDLFCRHRVMQGHHVARKAGWDTHGLPVEIEVEKQLGISGKRDIERIGVERFNALCRESVWKYKDEWEKLSTRIGFDLDYRDPYVTYSLDYVESVWWALKTLFDRELLYRGHKVLPYCPRCGTALSSHEVAQGYREVDDPSVYLALELSSATPHSPLPGPRILVWTTTPWTLVSNAALAVNPELIYIELAQRDGDAAHGSVILAEARAAAVLGDDYTDRWEIVGRQLGRELAGRRYRRPIDWVDYAEGEREVIIAEPFVSGEDGTGVVHMSPAFGTDDYAAGKRHGLAFLQPVNLRGEFPEGTPVIGGKFVKAADPVILEELRKRGLLWRAERLRHSYPHCWRCDTPLLYYARESWFVRTTAFKDQLLSRNARVNWQPEDVGEGRFGEWLKNNIDWALSRDRYWGTPLPIWVCDADRAHIEAVGGYADLAERLGAPLPSDFDPHKPFIDRYSWLCAQHRDGSKCGGTMRRAPEVIDTWFDSGSMPFAQWHYPFENRESVERQYPADFIAEGLDQTRGWFYSLLAIATGLGDALPNNVGPAAEGFGHMAAPFRAAVVNGLVLDAEGQKMSKTRGNTVEPWEVIQRHGADALRLFLVASSQVWLPKQFDEDTIRETAGRFLLTLKNTYSGMFAQYANYGWAPSELDPAVEDRPVIDRWIVSRISTVEREVDGFLERLEPTLALRAVMDFLVDDVSNWYVRQSRSRFYDVDGDENRAAFATLHEVLVVTCRLLAPFAPFVSDWVHRELTGSSVHLASYTRADSVSPDQALEVSMRQLRVLATLGRAAREEAGIKVRQPLAKLVCVIPPAGSLASQLLPLLRAELNVKSVEFVSSGAEFVRLEAKPSFRVLGKRFGKRTPLAAQAIAALSDRALREFESGVQVGITIDGETHVLQDDDFAIVHRAAGELVVKEEGGYFAALDIAVTPELRAEGLARELVSRVQRMRKEAGLDVSDRIMLWVNGDKQVERAASDFQDYISAEVLARQVVIGGEPVTPNNATQMVDLDGSTVSIALLRTN